MLVGGYAMATISRQEMSNPCDIFCPKPIDYQQNTKKQKNAEVRNYIKKIL